MPTLTIPKTWSTNESPLRSTDLNSNFSSVATLLNTTGLDTTNLQTGIITNSYINSAAAISVSKLASGTAAQFLANVSTTPTWVDSAGDVTFTTSGTTATFAIASGVIVNADINSSAAIAYSKLNLATSILNADVSTSAAIAVSKLASGTSGQVLGVVGTTPTYVSSAGDVTWTTSGTTLTTAIGTNKVAAAMLATSAITLGYAEVTADITGTTSSTAVAQSGLSSTVTIPAGGRKVKITAWTRRINNNTAGASTARMTIWDGTVGSGTQLSEADVQTTAANHGAHCTAIAVHTPSAGSKTYNVGLAIPAGGGGTVTLQATATAPAFILVEAI